MLRNKNGLPLHFALEIERLHREYSSCMDERDPSKGADVASASATSLSLLWRFCSWLLTDGVSVVSGSSLLPSPSFPCVCRSQ